jgi:ADP-ribose pyrophosphatase
MIKERRVKYKGFLNIEELDIETRTGEIIQREVMTRPDAVAALVYDTIKERYIFVSQFRPGTGKEILEIVAGTLDKPGEDPKLAMEREVLEEIGYLTDSIETISAFYVSPGGTTEYITVFYCEVSDKIADGGGLADENEEIDIVYLSKKEVHDTIFEDAKTIISLNWLTKNWLSQN